MQASVSSSLVKINLNLDIEVGISLDVIIEEYLSNFLLLS